MISKIEIRNYKCFPELEMNFSPLTLLCGVNSGGKSSVIQAILMGIETLEQNRDIGTIDLMNCKYNIDLYSFNEILYEEADDDLIQIVLQGKEEDAVLTYTSMEEDNNLKFRVEGNLGKSYMKNRVWYLASERMISKYQKRGDADNLELGKDNEYIGFILERGRSAKIEIDKDRSYKDKENNLFAAQVNQWLDFILPGNQVMAAASGMDNLVSLSFGKEYRRHRTNVGYGIGFVLPIIVAGLLAEKGDILIIENPELHLHPKAQSDLAFFLATLAAAGVQVMLETHSDHIVNGVRKAVVNPECGFHAEHASVYYFDMDNHVSYLKVDKDARLSEWPDGFMEQTEMDLFYLRKMRTKE